MGKKRRIFQRNGKPLARPVRSSSGYATHPELHEEEDTAIVTGDDTLARRTYP